MNDDARILELIRSSIDDNRIEEARSLLRPLMERNVVEAFYLASKVAYTQEQALEFLRYALELDPDNTIAREALTKLETLYTNQSNQTGLTIADPGRVAVSAPVKEKVQNVVALFEDYGWKTVIQGDDNAQFARRQTMSALNAFFLGLLFHVPGLILTLVLILTGKRLHAFIEADEDDIVLSTSTGDMLLHRPRQAVIFLDKTSGVNLVRGLALAALGVLLGSLVIWLLLWQTNMAFTDMFEAIATQATMYPDA